VPFAVKELNIKQIIKRLIYPKLPHCTMHEHINYFRPKTFEKMLELNGFEVFYNKVSKFDNLFGQTKIISCLAKKIK